MWLVALVALVVTSVAVVLARIGVFNRVAGAVLTMRALLRAADDQIFGR
jgi:hypothetical protein